MTTTTHNVHRLLLIVDPQNDFIDGTLPVPGAAEAMDALSSYVEAHGHDYAAAVVTADWHPYDHCSFAAKGGPWPAHCVQHSVGAAIHPTLLAALHAHCRKVVVLTKGNDARREEYSIMRNAASAQALRHLIAAEEIGEVDVCGLAGDVCVLNTWTDAKAELPQVTFRVMERYAPSLDGGQTLHQAIGGEE